MKNFKVSLVELEKKAKAEFNKTVETAEEVYITKYNDLEDQKRKSWKL